MKKLILVSVTTIFVFFMSQTFAQDSANSKFEKVAIKCSVKCNSCKEKIEKNIAFEKGVKDLVVDLDTKTVTIKYNKEKTTPEKLESALQKLDFQTEITKCTDNSVKIHKCDHSVKHDCINKTEAHDCKTNLKSDSDKKCCNKKTETK